MGGVTVFALDGQETHDFPMLKPPNFDKIGSAEYIEGTIPWDFAQPFPLTRNAKLKLRITKRAYETLLDKVDRTFEE